MYWTQPSVSRSGRARSTTSIGIRTEAARALVPDFPRAMIRKRHAPRRGADAALGGTLAPVLLVHGYGQNPDLLT